MSLNPRLVAAEKKLSKAEDAFAAVAKDVQKKCKHEVVHARPSGRPFQYLDTYWQEARVCKACGLYEEGDWGRFKKLTTKNVVMHDFNFSIYSHRIEVSPTVHPQQNPVDALHDTRNPNELRRQRGW